MAEFVNTAVPDKDFQRNILLDRLGNRSFALIYDFETRRTRLHIASDDADVVVESIEESVPGLEFLPFDGSHITGRTRASLVQFYRHIDDDSETLQLSDVFETGADVGLLCFIFVPQTYESAGASKRYIEMVLSETVTRESSVVTGIKHTSTSLNRELFKNSEETAMLKEIVESANESILSNGIVYKAFVAVVGTPPSVAEYVRSKFLVLSSRETTFTSVDALVGEAGKMDGLPLGRSHVVRFVNFYGGHAISYTIPTTHAETKGGIEIGNVMASGVHESRVRAAVDRSTFNLGMIISGLPGSGKTHLAMHVLDSIISVAERPKIAIISQTDEWDGFAGAHKMHLVRLCNGTVPINLFRCPEGIDTVRFGEDLAMVLAAAADAGPYMRPMEKCLVNAFRKVYAGRNREPDPATVYEEIQESIIRLHGKRTATGVKYTKHGENIKSALEHLADILRMPEYSLAEGVRIEELISNGVVFDLSLASIKTKAYFYALLLNQLYATASKLDSNGDDELRMLICIEEAQLVFGDEDSAAVEDIRYRLQDFRKRGIGLMLITHNVVDIDPGIRRLCQLKVYFKQAADIAPIAARDLVFSGVKDEDVIQKLKHLNSRTGAFSFVDKRGYEKVASDTVFIRTGFYQAGAIPEKCVIDEYMATRGIGMPGAVDTTVLVNKAQACRTMRHPPVAIRVSFVDETVATLLVDTAKDYMTFSLKLSGGRLYTFESIDDRGIAMDKIVAKAGRIININLGGPEPVAENAKS